MPDKVVSILEEASCVCREDTPPPSVVAMVYVGRLQTVLGHMVVFCRSNTNQQGLPILLPQFLRRKCNFFLFFV